MKKQKGMTLVEVMVATAITGVMASIAIADSLTAMDVQTQKVTHIYAERQAKMTQMDNYINGLSSVNPAAEYAKVDCKSNKKGTLSQRYTRRAICALRQGA